MYYTCTPTGDKYSLQLEIKIFVFILTAAGTQSYKFGQEGVTASTMCIHHMNGCGSALPPWGIQSWRGSLPDVKMMTFTVEVELFQCWLSLPADTFVPLIRSLCRHVRLADTFAAQTRSPRRHGRNHLQSHHPCHHLRTRQINWTEFIFGDIFLFKN